MHIFQPPPQIKSMSFITKRPYLTIACLVLVIFCFSANRAWVHHRIDSNGGYVVSAYPKNIPFMWQFDKDAMEFFQAAAFFPDFYKTNPALVGRPVLPLLSHLIGKGILTTIFPLLETQLGNLIYEDSGVAEQAKSTMEKRDSSTVSTIEFLQPYFGALCGYIVAKILLFILAGCVMYELLRRYIPGPTALFAISMLYFSPYAITSIGTYHTYEFQILTPILIIFLFHKLCDSYSLRRNILFSLVVGILMMAKANYASYIAVIMYAALFLKPKPVVYGAIFVSGLAHLVPWATWTVFIETHGMPVIGFLSVPDPRVLAIHPADIIGRKLNGLHLVSAVTSSGSHDQPGVDVFQNLFQLGMTNILILVKNNLIASIATFTTFSGLLAAIGLVLYKNLTKKSLLVFVAIFLFTTWLQAFLSFPYGPKGRTLYDINFLISGFASFAIFLLVSKYAGARKNVCLGLVLSVYILYNLFSFVRLPWVHPHDQVAYSSKHLDIQLSTHKNGYIYKRVPRSRDNLTVKPRLS